MPTRSERIRERRDTSSESLSIGTCTRRPSLVTTMATLRRSGRFKAPTVRAVYVPIRPNATTCTRLILPGGDTGWHGHTGPVLITVKSGMFRSRVDADVVACP